MKMTLNLTKVFFYNKQGHRFDYFLLVHAVEVIFHLAQNPYPCHTRCHGNTCFNIGYIVEI